MFKYLILYLSLRTDLNYGIIMTKNEIDMYYDRLTSTLESQKWDIALNKDRAHNAMVMRLLLNSSDNISMYCGEMSVFRQAFYDHISNNNKENDEERLGDYLKEKMIDSMNHFLSKDKANLQIILEKKVDQNSDDLIFGEEFKQGIAEGKIAVYYLSDNMLFKGDISHFAVSDSVIRMERDRKEHSAICAINPPEDQVTTMLNLFNTLKKMSTKLAS